MFRPPHGGADPGAVYNGRQEKDDNLELALKVGKLLESQGIDVLYTRTEDVYQTPFEKAQIANRAGADYFISFHRNSSPEPNQYNGVETLVYDKSGLKLTMAENINGALEALGFKNLGVKARPGLVVLRRTRMPALLIETGFLNTDQDNALYDQKNQEIARAIANAILGHSGSGNHRRPARNRRLLFRNRRRRTAPSTTGCRRVLSGIGKTRINCSTSCWIRDIRLFSSMKTDITRYR